MRLALLLVLALALAGCGGQRRKDSTPLTFEELRDTTGLSKGGAVLTKVAPYRVPGGALHVRGTVNFPNGTRLQVSLYRPGAPEMVARIQVLVRDHRFDSSPIFGSSGPLPTGTYRFEYLALFNEAWQTPEVLERTDDGRTLRGTGITRDAAGGAAFYLVEERKL